MECGFPNEQECQRYQRDHCLHGTAPRAVEVVDLEGCRTALEAAQACAGDIGPDTLVDACSDPIEGASTAVPSACEVIVRPELAAACAFLVAEDPLDPEPEESESEEPAS